MKCFFFFILLLVDSFCITSQVVLLFYEFLLTYLQNMSVYEFFSILSVLVFSTLTIIYSKIMNLLLRSHHVDIFFNNYLHKMP